MQDKLPEFFFIPYGKHLELGTIQTKFLAFLCSGSNKMNLFKARDLGTC